MRAFLTTIEAMDPVTRNVVDASASRLPPTADALALDDYSLNAFRIGPR